MINENTNEEWIETHKVSDGPTLQVRVSAGNGVLHLQGYGVIQNRDYGFAHKYNVPHEVTQWLLLHEATHMSFASDSIYYIRGVKVTQFKDGIQLRITPEQGHTGNDGTDFVLDLNTAKYMVAELMDFVGDNDGLLVISDQTKMVIE